MDTADCWEQEGATIQSPKAAAPAAAVVAAVAGMAAVAAFVVPLSGCSLQGTQSFYHALQGFDKPFWHASYVTNQLCSPRTNQSLAHSYSPPLLVI